MKNTITLILIILTLSACVTTTYHVTTESMLQQFANLHADTRQTFVVDSPLVFPGAVTGGVLSELDVLDAKGNEHTILVKNNTALLITTRNGRQEIYHFSNLILQNNTLYGKYSSVKLDDIIKIEVTP
ncbi:MAG: hypothetical protein C5B59_15940 [Bacteroidetes bacterium]|nr:MAG: hypothetical protein C5B59_15940 [Bacteroidota bacterium]